jgi:predicted nucleic acid-binding protein
MSKTVVVSDAAPLISLSSIDQLYLLNKLFDRVLIPPAVWHEVVGTGGEKRPGSREVSSATWIEQALAPALDESIAGLGPGEAEAIALARTLPDVLLLIDDAPGRKRARSLGIPLVGTLGVLRNAKVRGYVVAIAPLIERLQARGFRVRDSLVDGLLRDVGEQHE